MNLDWLLLVYKRYLNVGTTLHPLKKLWKGLQNFPGLTCESLQDVYYESLGLTIQLKYVCHFQSLTVYLPMFLCSIYYKVFLLRN